MPTPAEFDQIVTRYAQQYGIAPAVAVAQIRRESANYRRDVVYGPFVGGAGERGIAQFTPGTWASYGEGPHTNAYDVDKSMTAWGRYMSHLLQKFKGDYTKALQGYNGGERNVDRGTVSSDARRYASEILSKANAGPANSTFIRTNNPSTNTDPDMAPDFPIPAWLPIVGLFFFAYLLLDD